MFYVKVFLRRKFILVGFKTNFTDSPKKRPTTESFFFLHFLSVPLPPLHSLCTMALQGFFKGSLRVHWIIKVSKPHKMILLGTISTFCQTY